MCLFARITSTDATRMIPLLWGALLLLFLPHAHFLASLAIPRMSVGSMLMLRTSSSKIAKSRVKTSSYNNNNSHPQDTASVSQVTEFAGAGNDVPEGLSTIPSHHSKCCRLSLSKDGIEEVMLWWVEWKNKQWNVDENQGERVETQQEAFESGRDWGRSC